MTGMIIGISKFQLYDFLHFFCIQMARLDSLPKTDEMTCDMLAYYFPEKALNPWERPSFWPHTKAYQPENDPNTKF